MDNTAQEHVNMAKEIEKKLIANSIVYYGISKNQGIYVNELLKFLEENATKESYDNFKKLIFSKDKNIDKRNSLAQVVLINSLIVGELLRYMGNHNVDLNNLIALCDFRQGLDIWLDIMKSKILPSLINLNII